MIGLSTWQKSGETRLADKPNHCVPVANPARDINNIARHFHNVPISFSNGVYNPLSSNALNAHISVFIPHSISPSANTVSSNSLACETERKQIKLLPGCSRAYGVELSEMALVLALDTAWPKTAKLAFSAALYVPQNMLCNTAHSL